jgi:hypothetical protein
LYNQLKVYDEERGITGPETFGSFRFYISKDVVLTKVDQQLSVDKKATVVRTDIQRNIVNLKHSTPGRVQGNPTSERLEIGFERLKDGTIPTFAFILKPESGSDLYCFEKDSNGYIHYGEEYYTVTYKKYKTVEPFLLYVKDVKERTRKRKMSGLK